MRRGLVILFLGLATALVGYELFYHAASIPSRRLLQSPRPELAWLKQEYHLNAVQFYRVRRLHKIYQRDCRTPCQLNRRESEQLKALLAHSRAVTPEITHLLKERAKTRTQCETLMLRHLVEISRCMTPAEGRRYLIWTSKACLNTKSRLSPVGDSICTARLHFPAEPRELSNDYFEGLAITWRNNGKEPRTDKFTT